MFSTSTNFRVKKKKAKLPNMTPEPRKGATDARPASRRTVKAGHRPPVVGSFPYRPQRVARRVTA